MNGFASACCYQLCQIVVAMLERSVCIMMLYLFINQSGSSMLLLSNGATLGLSLVGQSAMTRQPSHTLIRATVSHRSVCIFFQLEHYWNFTEGLWLVVVVFVIALIFCCCCCWLYEVDLQQLWGVIDEEKYVFIMVSVDLLLQVVLLLIDHHCLLCNLVQSLQQTWSWHPLFLFFSCGYTWLIKIKSLSLEVACLLSVSESETHSWNFHYLSRDKPVSSKGMG